MATLTESPTSPVPLNGCLAWTLTKGSPGVGEIIRTGYKLISGADEIVGLSASDLATFRGNFIDDVKNLVDSTIPTPGPGVRNETLFEKEVKLVYGDIVIDEESCESTVTVTTESAAVNVINAYTGFLREDLDILSSRPNCYELHQLSEDYIWLYGTGTYGMAWEFKDGTSDSAAGSAAFDVNIIPVTPKAFDLAIDYSKLASSTLTINQGGNTWTYTVRYFSCPQFFDLHWLEPLGSYSTISFEEFSAQATGENNIVDLNSICPTHSRGEVNLWNAQQRVQNVSGGVTLNLQKRVASTHENLMYLKNLGRNRGAYGIFNGDGNRIGLNINPGGINIHTSGEVITLTIQAEITE